MLFADSLLESRNQRRGWTTLLSYLAEAMLVALLVVAPLIRTTALPGQRLSAPLVVSSSSSAPSSSPGPSHPGRAAPSLTEPAQDRLLTPTRIPQGVMYLADELPPPSPSGNGSGGPGGPGWGGFGSGGPGGVPWGLGDAPPPALPRPPAPHAPIRVSHLSPADLVSGLHPLYPPAARTARIDGSVVLSAVIARDGTIQRLQVLSGHPMLVAAAVDAVRQWRYRPYLLNNEPVEVETQITVNFTLAH